MDRILAYVDENMLVEDFLNSEKNTMIALGMALQAVLGTTTLVDGLACTPTSPASLQVLVAQGSILNFGNIDGTAYGDIGSDTSHQIVKQGIVIGNTTFTITVPSTSGFSQRYLIQAEFQDQDTGSTVLPYYNASNPSVAWNGPNNTGTSQNTLRKGACVLSLKAGTAATTGTQTTPTPDAGFIGLWVVNVANGATTITSGNITPYSGITAANGTSAAWSAPFITEKLMDKVSIATGDLRWAPIAGGGGTTRSRLTNNTNYYVTTTGNDSTGDGSSGAPWLTIQHAINVIAGTVDLGGFTATINVATGTYAGFAVSEPFVGGLVQLTGDTTTPTNCVISSTTADCIQLNGLGIQLGIAGFQLTTSGSGGNGISATNGGRAIVNGNMNYGAVASGNAHLIAGFGSQIDVSANYTISGGAFAHVSAQNNGVINMGGVTATLSGSPAFAHAFFWLQILGLVWGVGYTVSGSGTGNAYLIQANSVLQMNGAGFTFTGASAGTADGSTFGLLF